MSDEPGYVWRLMKRMDEIQKSTEEKIQHIRGDLVGLREVMNNGIVERAIENTEAVENLQEEVEEMKMCIKGEEKYRSGKKQTAIIIISVLSGLGSGIIGVLTILNFLGVI